jgi:hypothetical protein
MSRASRHQCSHEYENFLLDPTLHVMHHISILEPILHQEFIQHIESLLTLFNSAVIVI